MPIKRLATRFLFVAFAFAAVISMAILAGCASSSGNADGGASAQDDLTASNEPVRIGAMKGPTAIGLADIISKSEDDYDFDIVTGADELTPKLASGELDIALIPANIAATLYNKDNDSIKVIDVNTMGVLYAVTANEDLIAGENVGIADLAGHTVYMTGKGTVPEYTLSYLLDQSGIDTSTVNIEFKSEPSEVVALISADPNAVGILPQPYATSACVQNEALKSVIDLTEQWDVISQSDAVSEGGAEGEGSTDAGRLVTGVTVVRTEFLENNPDLVESFLLDHANSVESVNDDPSKYADTLVELGIIGNAKVAELAIPLCNIVCMTDDEMESALSGYLSVLNVYAPQAIGGALPDDGFYFMGFDSESK